MNRVYNEMTSDEVHRSSGVKIGNFGVGGRTYTKYKRGYTSNTAVRRCIVGGLFILLGGWFYSTETSVAQLTQCTQQIYQEAQSVAAPFHVDHQLDGALIYAASPNPAVNSPAPRDPFFGVDFASNVASSRRVTEYCQWEEFQHTTRTKVGTDSSCGSNDERCNIYKEVKSYTYHKGWRSHTVNSLRFDNPTAYHNPLRNPCPSEVFHAPEGVRLDGSRGQEGEEEDVDSTLHLTSADASEALMSWNSLPLHQTTAHQATVRALSHGFHEADSSYIYSRGDRDGWSSPLVNTAMSFFADGVMDLSGMVGSGSCNVGDIRVSFQVKTVPPRGMSVAGKQLPSGQIAPFHCRGKAKGMMVLGYPDGSLSLPEMVEKVTWDAQFWAMFHRAGQGLATVVLLSVLGYRGDGRSGDKHPDAYVALFLAGAAWGSLWLWNGTVDLWCTIPMMMMAIAGKDYSSSQKKKAEEGPMTGGG